MQIHSHWIIAVWAQVFNEKNLIPTMFYVIILNTLMHEKKSCILRKNVPPKANKREFSHNTYKISLE